MISHYICLYVSIKVIKMDMMCPFYIDYHINIDLKASVLFVRMNRKRILFSLKLPFRCMSIENGFGYHNNGD